jgi:nitroreductase
MFRELVLKNRSVRKFKQNEPVAKETLKELVDLARLSASGANMQPLKYILSCSKDKNELIFPNLAWAGYLKDWDAPAEGQRPAGYIIILGDTQIRKSFGCDHGVAAQSILLGAAEKGLSGCMIGSVNREKLRKNLGIPNRYEILLVIALGKADEKVVLEDKKPEGDIKYYRDSEDTHHVPKRPLDEVIIE